MEHGLIIQEPGKPKGVLGKFLFVGPPYLGPLKDSLGQGVGFQDHRSGSPKLEDRVWGYC